MSLFICTADWDNNAPHLSETAKKDLWESIPAYQKDARSKGIPQLGAGVIYPVPEDDLLVDAFAIPKHWPRGYGLDVGWNRTAAIWRCYDPDAEPRIHYLYDEHYMGEANPIIHGAAIRRRGSWVPGRIDPAAHGRTLDDGKKVMTTYRKAIYGEEDLALGMRLLQPGNNAVESGLYAMLMLMTQGLLKVMRGRCPNWLAERRLYRRDERGRIIKKNDHALDASRYNVFTGDSWLETVPLLPLDGVVATWSTAGGDAALDWMGRI